MNFNEFEKLADHFFIFLEKQMSESEISVPVHWDIDHLCYRVETVESYLEKKDEFSKFGKLLIESDVNGRPISTFKLNNPFQFLGRKIALLELPAPKKNKKIVEGFEHIEIVCDQTFTEIKKRYGNAEIDEKGLNKSFNAELALKLKGMAIKFHHLSLKSVVTLEGNQRVFSALVKSKVLEECNEFDPLIVGTFPLGIETAKSDLDILLFHEDLDEALLRLDKVFSSNTNFESFQKESKGGRYGIVRFSVDDVPFELYVESTKTVQQRAYKHFQIEERLLKGGGESFREKILGFRQKGLKTERAFAEALNIEGDPFLKILEMQNWSAQCLEEVIKSAHC